MTVPLDRAGAVPGTITLSVERRAPSSGQSRGAVLALAGGPGQAVLPYDHDIAEAISPALAGRDLLLFDQRGTGASGPLNCSALSGAEAAAASTSSELIERCARQLGPARGAYTTSESVEDIEAVRQATGYEKLVLYGTSYGTKVALEYAQRYPQHVEGLVLDSTETPEGPEPFQVGTFKAVGPALAELCAGDACTGVTSNPLTELAQLVASISVRPMVGVVYSGSGKRTTVPITTGEVFALLKDGDLNPQLRAEMPSAVHSALKHDPAPLARMLAIQSLRPMHEEPGGGVDETLFFDTSCEETPFPWRRSAPEAVRAVEAEAAVGTLPSSDFYPFNAETALLGGTIPFCVGWPDAAAAPQLGATLPDVPTLILSGGQDLRTPTENARRVASMIPDAQLLTVPYTGHSVLGSDVSGCAHQALEAFFAGARVQLCKIARDPFPPVRARPARLSSLMPLAGLPPAPGRTLAAALASLLDLRDTVVEIALNFGELPVGARFGGLRGGTVEITKAGAELRGFSYVPGVRLGGLVPMTLLLKDQGSAASLTVGGPPSASGSVRVAAGGRVSGLLGGHRFAVEEAASASIARRGADGVPTSLALSPVSLPHNSLGRLP